MGLRGQDRQIDNIEFNVSDIARSKAFYGAAFGWAFVDYGPSYTEFSDGRIAGGFTTGEPVRPGGPLVILYADDLVQTQRRVEAAGAPSAARLFRFPADVDSISSTRTVTSWLFGRQANHPRNPTRSYCDHHQTGLNDASQQTRPDTPGAATLQQPDRCLRGSQSANGRLHLAHP